MKSFKSKSKSEKVNALLDLDDVSLSELCWMREIEVLLEPGPGEDGKPEIHAGILFIKKNKVIFLNKNDV